MGLDAAINWSGKNWHEPSGLEQEFNLLNLG
jgi:hypothetical protein